MAPSSLLFLPQRYKLGVERQKLDNSLSIFLAAFGQRLQGCHRGRGNDLHVLGTCDAVGQRPHRMLVARRAATGRLATATMGQRERASEQVVGEVELTRERILASSK